MSAQWHSASKMSMTLVDDPSADGRTPNRTVEVMFNPQEFEHVAQAVYQRHVVPGLGYQPKHYVSTTNSVISMELFYRALDATQLAQLYSTMNFIRSLLSPVATESVGRGGNPRVLVIWPRVLSMVCTLSAVAERFVKFSHEGHVMIARARVEFEEIRNAQLLSAEVAEFGLQRRDTFDIATKLGGGS